MEVVELATHRSLRTLTDTAALKAQLAPVLKRPVEFFTVDVSEGVTLDGWMLKPLTSIRVGAIQLSSSCTASQPVKRSSIAGAAAVCSFIGLSPTRATSS